jgi:lipopolysaccharide transport system ATP-binding protein
MSTPIIEVDGLSKVYNISHRQKAPYGTLRDDMTRFFKKPLDLVIGERLPTEEFWALEDINFEINAGEAVGIIGRNGSGKSTLLKILSRIVEPTDGQAILRGKTASLLEVGTGFHPELTGRENVYFNGSILGMSRREINSKFDEIVEFAEVEKFLDTPVKFYSSGMHVRLAFAVAAHLEPEILIVDEVLAVGDAQFQKKCLGKMKDVASEGRTVLFVSHNMPSIRALCDKAIWLEGGNLREIGPIEAITDRYARSSAGSTVELAQRARTTTVSLEAKIVGVSVNNTGSKDSIIDSSDEMEVRFEIESQTDIKDVIVHCGINASGQMVMRLMSEFQNQAFDLKKGRNTIVCEVPATNLTGGVYSVDISILNPGREVSGHIDEIFDALTFSVRDFQVEPGGQVLTQREAVFFAPSKWSINT